MEFFEEEETTWGNPLHHLIAGSVAGTLEHCGMFPLDTIKTHAQSAGASESSIREISKSIYRQYGIRGYFRGLPALISGAAPGHAVFFGMYEFTKFQFGGNMMGHRPIETAAAGACATMMMDGILTPMDAVKQKMQLSTGNYSNFFDCIKHVRANQGIRSLYAGFSTTLVMNIPYHAFFFSSYESYKILLMNWKKGEHRKDDEEESVFVHLSCGAGAGVTASALTNPLDVAKTRLQTQHDTGKRYKGMVDALKTIGREEGVTGFMRGIRPRIILHSCSAAIVWSTYEYMKVLLTDSKTKETVYHHIDP